MNEKLTTLYNSRKQEIKTHIKKFNLETDKERYLEFLFCTLTPQSNAQKCWEAVKLIEDEKPKTQNQVAKILKGRSRFHNVKSKRIINAKKNWVKITELIENEKDSFKLRNEIEKQVNGFGLKESSHFLRNIGLSNNKVAILDRHILKNLIEYGAIKQDKIKSKKHYLELEKQALEFADKVNIPIDELDVLFWHIEHGEFFK